MIMEHQISNYQCPACTGPLQFSPDTGKVECEYCGSVYELAEIEAMYAQQEPADAQAEQWDTTGLSDDWGADAEGMKTYSCPSCTAERSGRRSSPHRKERPPCDGRSCLRA